MYCCFVEVGDLAMLQGMCHTRSIFDTQHRPCDSLEDDLHLHEITRHSRGLDMEDEVRQTFLKLLLAPLGGMKEDLRNNDPRKC